jgi:hypothetical protein
MDETTGAGEALAPTIATVPSPDPTDVAQAAADAAVEATAELNRARGAVVSAQLRAERQAAFLAQANQVLADAQAHLATLEGGI